jgi:hypothetical protein
MRFRDWRPRRRVGLARHGGSAVSWVARGRPGSRVSRARVARTPAELLRILGRVALWCLILVLLVRGLNDVLSARAPEPAASPTPAAAAEWPGDEARAFAVRFTRAYLGYVPRDGAADAAELRGLVSPEIANAVVPVTAAERRPPAVREVIVAGARRVDDRRALVTVAATVAGSTVPRFLTVPVARDDASGLVVSDLPAFSAAPPRAVVSAQQLEPLSGSDRAAIEDLLTRFFKSFLAGDSDQLAYLAPAGTRLQAVAAPLQLAGVDSVSVIPGGSGVRWLSVSLRARDRDSEVIYGLRYRVRVVQGDRWYVASLDSSPKGG